jgi:hypothetical protein
MDQGTWANHPDFQYEASIGWYTTIGAGSVDGNLTADFLRDRDQNLSHNTYSAELTYTGYLKELLSGILFENQMIEKLIQMVKNYIDKQDKLDYELCPGKSTDGYNSNGFINGLLNAAGVDPYQQPPTTPGFTKVLSLN